ncbi:MAG: DUF1570 domain-containing protein [Lacipirellulaceae bacterium]
MARTAPPLVVALLWCAFAAALLSLAAAAPAMDVVSFREMLPSLTPGDATPVAGPATTITGQTLARDREGGLVVESVEGGLYLLAGEDVLDTSKDDRPFAPLSPVELGDALLKDLPQGFRVHTTDHYVVAYNTSREFAEWTSSLLEGLHKALVAFWRKRGLRLAEPRFPLPIVIHESRTAYQVASRGDLGAAGLGAIGYYNLKTNRVRMYDLTGSEELRGLASSGPRRGSRREVSMMLATPAAEPLVSTIVHEATHQVAFNTGILQRYSDLPLWLVEGMAVYFEAPEAGASRGWRGVGKPNPLRYQTFVANLPNWNKSSLTSLLASDKRLRDPRTGPDAYADAWALTYYLLKRRPDDYVAYVKRMGAKKAYEAPAPGDAPKRRLKEFTDHFGPLDALEEDFLETMQRL